MEINFKFFLTATHQVGTNAPELMSHNTYNELGQLISKNVGGSDTTGSVGLQKVDYAYNIRGWLKAINNVEDLKESSTLRDLFAFRINYNGEITESVNGNVTSLFNGNISETYWRSNSDEKLRKYGYTYDEVNRMTDAWYQMPEDASPKRHSYDEQTTYDKNGNIQTLKRNGDYDHESAVIPIDDLEYVYHEGNKNQLLNVIDHEANPSGFNDVNGEGNDYEYDSFGNMKSDANKRILGILYNHLNLPVHIEFAASIGSISYLYTATGMKIRKEVYKAAAFTLPATTTQTDYIDGYQYYKGNLQFFPTAEGYVDHTMVQGTQHYNYVYQFKDHLGNIRMNYAVDPADDVLKIKDENHYYPFGLKHTNYNSEEYSFREFNAGIRLLGKPPVEDPNFFPKDGYDYKYNGKEWQDELNLNLYDYGARNYDPAIGRWMNIDLLAEVSRRWSPYNYCYNNPLVFVDPDGMSAKWWRALGGNNSSSIEFKGEDAKVFAKSLQDSMDTENLIKNSWDETSIISWLVIQGESGNGGGSAVEGYQPTLTEQLMRLANYTNPIGLQINSINSSMSRLTGQNRHLYGPDALIFTKSVEGGAIVGGAAGVGFIIVLRGSEAGVYALGDYGVGLSGISISTGFTGQAIYYSGKISDIDSQKFAGSRTSVSVGGDLFASLGVNTTYANLGNGTFTYGVGVSAGIGASMTVVDFNINWGNTVIKK